MLKRKLKKLIRDPKLFFSDMSKNNIKKKNALAKKLHGNYDYTVVSAVYNVEKYLNDYFKSFENQSLNFKNNIKLILVDDGSIDSSASIIKKWTKKYPNNITYIYKENGGQASARNLGLCEVKTKWVTFIDPDDFVDPEFFLSMDNFLLINEKRNISLVATNLILYFENSKQYKDTHPLRYRFNKGDITVPVHSMGKQIQLSASTGCS